MNKKNNEVTKVTTENVTALATVETGYVEVADIGREGQLVSEINMITGQMLFNIIEIGRRLSEAKKLVKHGQWSNWLKERVNYSQSTANNFMKVFKKYGESGLAANSQSIANLSYTQALVLMNVPSEECEKLAKETSEKDMTIKELQEKVKNLTSEKSATETKIAGIEKKYQQLMSEKDKALTQTESDKKALSAHIQELEKQFQKVEASKEQEVQNRLSAAIKAEKEKLEAVESHAKKLEGDLDALQNQQKDEIKKAVEAEKENSKKVLAKKDEELARVKTNMKEHAKEAAAKLAAVESKYADEVAKNDLAADMAKCTHLIDELLDNYAEAVDIILKLKKSNRKEADTLLLDLENGLKVLKVKAKFQTVS